MRALTFLFLPIFLFANAGYAIDNGNLRESDTLNESRLAMELYVSFLTLKHNDDLDIWKNEMNDIGFLQADESRQDLGNNQTSDSIVFENDHLKRYAYGKIQELGYLRHVQLVMVISTENNREIFDSFYNMLAVDGSEIDKEFNQKGQLQRVRFTDTVGATVVVERSEVVKTRSFDKLYEYDIALEGKFLVLSFNEVIPKTTLENMISM